VYPYGQKSKSLFCLSCRFIHFLLVDVTHYKTTSALRADQLARQLKEYKSIAAIWRPTKTVHIVAINGFSLHALCQQPTPSRTTIRSRILRVPSVPLYTSSIPGCQIRGLLELGYIDLPRSSRPWLLLEIGKPRCYYLYQLSSNTLNTLLVSGPHAP